MSVWNGGWFVSFCHAPVVASSAPGTPGHCAEARWVVATSVTAVPQGGAVSLARSGISWRLFFQKESPY